MKRARLTIIAICGAVSAFSQDVRQGALPVFEAASVKPADPNSADSSFHFGSGALRIEGGTLRRILEMAYNLRTFQILGGPAWLDADRYDIVAKSDAALTDVSREQRYSEMRQRLQTLLADRFRLKVHREIREWPEYALTAAKDGPRLAAPEPGANNGIKTGCGVLKGTGATMSDLVMMLSRQMDRPVLDRTTLTERYDFEMNYSPDSGCGSRFSEAGAGDARPLTDRPSIFTAIQEQLGLKLESIKGPVEVIVVDRAERPGPN
jgi:uncharacterized protein (TIGR03435 family)